MIITKKIEPKRLYLYTKKNGLYLLVVSLLAAASILFIPPDNFKALSLPAGIVGTALAFLIGFRNNKAYERWWEARKIWGKLVNDSRYFGLLITGFLNEKNSSDDFKTDLKTIESRIIYKHIAFVWALNKHLRKIEWESELKMLLEKAQLNELKTKDHVPYALLKSQTDDLKDLRQKDYFNSYEHVALMKVMENFNDAAGKSERIKNTVFPMQYNWYMQYAMWVFLAMLPFSLLAQFGIWTLPISMAVGYIFILLEYLGRQIEKPFENHPSDTPINALSRTIEINLKELLGEKNLPEKEKPVDGKFLF